MDLDGCSRSNQTHEWRRTLAHLRTCCGDGLAVVEPLAAGPPEQTICVDPVVPFPARWSGDLVEAARRQLAGVTLAKNSKFFTDGMTYCTL